VLTGAGVTGRRVGVSVGISVGVLVGVVIRGIRWRGSIRGHWLHIALLFHDDARHLDFSRDFLGDDDCLGRAGRQQNEGTEHEYGDMLHLLFLLRQFINVQTLCMER
jgi:hypothetical protein